MNACLEALHAPVPPQPALRRVTLDDKYTATRGEIYLSGIRGYGHVKLAGVVHARARWNALAAPAQQAVPAGEVAPA
ncbi:hypothetical protein D3C71_1378430 [compost metagenome]